MHIHTSPLRGSHTYCDLRISNLAAEMKLSYHEYVPHRSATPDVQLHA